MAVEGRLRDWYITCPDCGYNNLKKRLKNYGTCLNCKRILDEQAYFRRKVRETMGKWKPRHDIKR